MLRPYLLYPSTLQPSTLEPRTLESHTLQPHASSYFTMKEIGNIYKFPVPNESKVVVGVISFGGGLVGKVSANVLTNGDVQAYWKYIGIPPEKYPTVIIVPVGATNNPNPNDSATIENTIDVETIGGLYPSSKLTILLYIAPNTLNSLITVLTAARNPTIINGVSYKPSVISCSWGAPESIFSISQLTTINNILQTAANEGIVFTAASGDNGSSDGIPGINVDFPSSSPYCLACGGTTLICPNKVYDKSTIETTWSYGGGGISKIFPKPSYQSHMTASGRLTPDIALNADPKTGVIYTIGGINKIVGGTSIVSPAMAAFAAIINNNKFITPLLYKVTNQNYNDIIAGSNGAYNATTGYDNCTGLGSIIGTTLASSINSIPITSITLTSITLTNSSIRMNINQQYKIVYTISPPNATNKTVSFSIANANIASITSSGIITAISNGTTIATVSSGTITAQLQITVISINVTRITLPSAVNLRVGSTISLNPVLYPSNATNKNIIWTTNNANIATVLNGFIRGISKGSATIIATVNDVTARCNVTVR